ncbi:unnamed protein product [Mesocestoides corti]|uniref:VWFA domain-containing protein n=1 Tax=Mesocestoides corti TaxID=53468 RepID=A0A158QVH2_MESCO|nr:unnamed protein product [Mesocestoides corti]
MFGVLVILTTCIASFTGVGVNGHFIVDTPSGCVDVAVNLPYEFSAVQVDHNRYEFDGNLTCSNMNVDNDYLECSLTLDALIPTPLRLHADVRCCGRLDEHSCAKQWHLRQLVGVTDPSGGFIAKVRVCDVENKVWVGFFVDRLLSWSHHAFVTAYFSHGGKWANINRNCIQPQLSGPLVIKAGGRDEVEIVCARKMYCPMGPYACVCIAATAKHFNNAALQTAAAQCAASKIQIPIMTLIMDGSGTVCNDFQEPRCIESYHEDMKIVKTVYAKPGGDDVSYVFCSTGDSFLSYAIDWANSDGGDDGIFFGAGLVTEIASACLKSSGLRSHNSL